MAKKTFKARLIRPEGVGTWTFLTVAFNAAEEYGSQGQVRVKGTINRLPYRSTLLPQGDGTHYLVVNGTIRDQIGVTHGDMVQVTMEHNGCYMLAARSVIRRKRALFLYPQPQGKFSMPV